MGVSSFELSAGQKFPAGTTVGAYRRSTFPGPRPPVAGQVPAVSAVTTAVVGSAGTALFSGLEAEVGYFAGALVAGAWRWLSFRTEPPDVVAEQARAEAAERRLQELIEAAA